MQVVLLFCSEPDKSFRFRQPVPKPTRQICLLWTCTFLCAVDAQADSCPTAKDEIATDRPDVTNSSLMVPMGSLQSENGVNFSARDGGRIVDGTNTRWRLGIAPCLEILLDMPTYFARVRAPGSSGFSDVAPAMKWQVSPIPGKVDLSLVLGAALPTGAAEIAGRGTQPYLQMPWSWELRDGWGLSGMLTEFFRPSELTSRRITETTFVIERKVTEKASLFVESIRSVCGEFHAAIVSSLSAPRMTILRASSGKDAAAPSLRPAFSDTKPVTK